MILHWQHAADERTRRQLLSLDLHFVRENLMGSGQLEITKWICVGIFLIVLVSLDLVLTSDCKNRRRHPNEETTNRCNKMKLPTLQTLHSRQTFYFHRHATTKKTQIEWNTKRNNIYDCYNLLANRMETSCSCCCSFYSERYGCFVKSQSTVRISVNKISQAKHSLSSAQKIHLLPSPLHTAHTIGTFVYSSNEWKSA